MLYLVFAGGALHGSTPDMDAAFSLADEAAEHLGSKPGDEDCPAILRVDGLWVSMDADGATRETRSDEAPYRPAPAAAPAPAPALKKKGR